MAMQQCQNGHVYDDAKNTNCPYCSGNGDVGITRPLTGAGGFEAPEFPKTVGVSAPAAPNAGSSSIPSTAPYTNPEINKTVALNINEKGIDPVRGWLICVEGEMKGKDFKILSEKNTVGRAKSNSICLDFDDSISKEANAIIAYDNRNNKFFITAGEGKNNIYINNNLLLAPVELHDYDTVELGKTKLIFRSLCNESFIWS